MIKRREKNMICMVKQVLMATPCQEAVSSNSNLNMAVVIPKTSKNFSILVDPMEEVSLSVRQDLAAQAVAVEIWEIQQDLMD